MNMFGKSKTDAPGGSSGFRIAETVASSLRSITGTVQKAATSLLSKSGIRGDTSTSGPDLLDPDAIKRNCDARIIEIKEKNAALNTAIAANERDVATREEQVNSIKRNIEDLQRQKDELIKQGIVAKVAGDTLKISEHRDKFREVSSQKVLLENQLREALKVIKEKTALITRLQGLVSRSTKMIEEIESTSAAAILEIAGHLAMEGLRDEGTDAKLEKLREVVGAAKREQRTLERILEISRMDPLADENLYLEASEVAAPSPNPDHYVDDLNLNQSGKLRG
jgi:hypothetical protein